MNLIIVSALLLLGTLFMVLASIGVLRMPDLLMRLSATTKASTLGIALMLVSAAFYFQEVAITSRVIATIIFVFLTAPISAHMIGRAAYFNKVELWEKTEIDELKGHYDLSTHRLERRIEDVTTGEDETD